MPEKKTVVEETDFRGNSTQFDLDVWCSTVYPRKLQYIGSLVMQGIPFNGEGNEDRGHYSYNEEGIACWTHWETKEIEVYSNEEKEQMMWEEYLDGLEED